MWKLLVMTISFGLIYQCTSQSFQWSGFQRDHWGPWSHWLPCSKPCGGGTQIRTRQCKSSSRNNDLPKFILKVYRQPNRGNCQGSDTQYITCNLQACFQSPKVTRQRAIEARAKQCKAFNGTSFNGHRFNWVPYLRVKDSEECELNCLAKGHKFFLRLLPTVKDGTPCLTNLKKVCIAGKCQDPPPGCEDGSCFGLVPTQPPKQRQSGVFTSKGASSRGLILGYNPVITIPSGATNINVTEIRKSKNYLALKSHASNKYYINGNWVIDLPKGYKVAGTLFYYTRPRRNKGGNEAFIAAGPTTEDLDIMLLYQDDEPTIKYSYLLPKRYPEEATHPPQPADPDQRGVYPLTTSRTPPGRANHVWRVTGFTQCSYSCAGGIQTTVYQCVRTVDQGVVDESLCPPNLKPAPRQRVCNLRPCPPRWEPGAWGKCSKTCGGGLQIRSLLCKQLIDKSGKRKEQKLPINYCSQWERPVPSQSCNAAACPPPANWTAGEWSKCSASCEQGIQQRSIQCVDINKSITDNSHCDHTLKPSTTRACSAGSCETSWYASKKWSHCSLPCGRGQQSRLVFCGRKGGNALPSGHCSHTKKPASTRPCNNGKCMAIWVVSDWSRCSVECGTGTQFRSVFCAGVVGGMYQEYPDDSCSQESKPATVRQCGNNSCQPEWFTTKWDECSRSCGGGSQFREVLCMDHMGQISNNCSSRTKPYHYQRCNNTPCPTSPGQVKDEAPCQDTYSHSTCVYVIQANFCQYARYRKMCCYSCTQKL